MGRVPQYACPDCGKTLTRHSDRQRHLNSHNLATQYACPWCLYMTSQRSNAVRHLAKEHPGFGGDPRRIQSGGAFGAPYARRHDGQRTRIHPRITIKLEDSDGLSDLFTVVVVADRFSI